MFKEIMPLDFFRWGTIFIFIWIPIQNNNIYPQSHELLKFTHTVHCFSTLFCSQNLFSKWRHTERAIEGPWKENWFLSIGHQNLPQLCNTQPQILSQITTLLPLHLWGFWSTRTMQPQSEIKFALWLQIVGAIWMSYMAMEMKAWTKKLKYISLLKNVSCLRD